MGWVELPPWLFVTKAGTPDPQATCAAPCTLYPRRRSSWEHLSLIVSGICMPAFCLLMESALV